jgi:hydroxymethylpyrimidine/phosphomethylpyrimidine kinase
VTIATEGDRRDAARVIKSLGPSLVVIKGGHFPAEDIVDLLYDGRDFTEFRHARIPGAHTHGTGCTFAAALAAHVALGRTLHDAIPMAQRYIAGAIEHAPGLGSGHGPMNHFWER